MKSRSVFLFLLLIIEGFRICNSELLDPVPEIVKTSSSSSSSSSVPDADLDREGSKHLPVPIRIPSPPTKYILLSVFKEHGTVLIASFDGTIYLVESKSGKVRWSFSSGPALSSSYHAPLDYDSDDDNVYELGEWHGTKSYKYDYFIESGDDWTLYEQSRHFGRRKLSKTIEEYVNGLPHISDGALTFGHKKLTSFLVDARTGRVVHTFQQQGFQSMIDERRDEHLPVLPKLETEDLLTSSFLDETTIEPLLIMRTDYSLQSCIILPKKLLWNTTIAKINVVSYSQGSENGPNWLAIDSRSGLEYQDDVWMSLPDVYSTRNLDLLPSELAFQLSNNPSESYHEYELLPLPAPQTQNSGNLNMLGENRILSDQLINSSEAEKTYLMEIDADDKQDTTGMFVIAAGAIIIMYCLIHLKKWIKGLPLMAVGVIWHFKKWIKDLPLMATDVIRHLKKWIKHVKSYIQPSDLDGKQAISTKRRKTRKRGIYKNSANTNKQDNHLSSENEDAETNGYTFLRRNDMGSLNFTKVVADGDGCLVGKLFVSNKVIAKGSNGTVVFEGLYDPERPTAVKRLVLAHNDVAFKEIENLRASDEHENIVRFYGVEQDSNFVYISLERCTCTLNDLIQLYSDTSLNSLFSGSPALSSRSDYKVRLQSIEGIDKGINLWKANAYPSSQLLKLMRDVVSGLAHLHELGIIHRDLKPHNVLISTRKSLCAKLSDMGISKRLHSGMTSLGHHVTGYGSSGWQAPEQLLHGRQTRAIDLFSLGCLLFFCITKGGHPFGDHLERDSNIVKNHFDFFLVEQIPEAVDLFSKLLDHDPEKRPKAKEVLHHPFFWKAKKRLSFLQEVSDRVELEDREGDSDIVKAMENVAPVALGGNWNEKLETIFITNIGLYRRYKYDNVCDLLRLIRNKLNHYGQLPEEIQKLLGPVPEGYYDYFASRFPKLLIEVYKVVNRYCRDEQVFRKYFYK